MFFFFNMTKKLNVIFHTYICYDSSTSEIIEKKKTDKLKYKKSLTSSWQLIMAIAKMKLLG